MASKRNYNRKQLLKESVSVTDDQYDEIVEAAIYPSDVKHLQLPDNQIKYEAIVLGERLSIKKAQLTVKFNIHLDLSISNTNTDDSTVKMTRKRKNKSRQSRKIDMSLTDKQYEEIFQAAIYPSDTTHLELSVNPTDHEVKVPITRSNKQNLNNIKYNLNLDSSISSKQPPKKKMSLTDHQYEEIFQAVIYPHLDLSISSINSDDFMNNAISSTPLDVAESLSQPDPTLTKKERLQWLQNRRSKGIYVKCDNTNCKKWRWLENPEIDDLPQKWYCYMNPDVALARCSAAQMPIRKEIKEVLIETCYTPGSIVWAKFPTYPWWPAMVDDCPDNEQYYWNDNVESKTPNWYHVVFFDNKETTRSWIHVENLRSYKRSPLLHSDIRVPLKFRKRFKKATEEAFAAMRLPIRQRLQQYSFLARWKEPFIETN